MSERRLRQLLQLNAVLYALLGALLVLSSWNELFATLELPRPEPALLAQIGGIALLGVAYLLWNGAHSSVRSVEVAAIAMDLLAAAVLALWLLFRDLDLWGVDALGYSLLTILLVAFAGLAAVEALTLARRRAD